jgi:hypothetical protein
MSKKPIRRGGFSLVGPVTPMMNAVAARTTPTATEPAPTASARPTVDLHDEIAMRAREIWEVKGCPADRDLEIWLSAEREMAAVHR